MQITTIIYTVLNGRAEEFINDFLLFALCLIVVALFGYAIYEIVKDAQEKKHKKIPKALKEYADRVFIQTGVPQEETIKRVIEGFKIFMESKEAKKIFPQ